MSHQSSRVMGTDDVNTTPSWWREADAIVAAEAILDASDVAVPEGDVSGTHDVANVVEDANEGTEIPNAVVEGDSVVNPGTSTIIRVPVPPIIRASVLPGPSESVVTKLAEIVNSLASASLNTPLPFTPPGVQLVIELDPNASLGLIYDRVLSFEAECRECLRRLSWDSLNMEIRRLSARYEAVMQALFGAHQMFWAILREQSGQGKCINQGLSEWCQVAPTGNVRKKRVVEDERSYWEGREAESRDAVVSAWHSCGSLLSQYVNLSYEVASFYSRVDSLQLRVESLFLNICAELGIQEESVMSSPE